MSIISHPRREAILADTLGSRHAAIDCSVAEAVATLSAAVGVACRGLQEDPKAEQAALLRAVLDALAELQQTLREELVGAPPLPRTNRQIAALLEAVSDLSNVCNRIVGRKAGPRANPFIER